MTDAPLPKTRFACEFGSQAYLSIGLNSAHAVIRVTDGAADGGQSAAIALTAPSLIELGQSLVEIGQLYARMEATRNGGAE